MQKSILVAIKQGLSSVPIVYKEGGVILHIKEQTKCSIKIFQLKTPFHSNLLRNNSIEVYENLQIVIGFLLCSKYISVPKFIFKTLARSEQG